MPRDQVKCPCCGNDVESYPLEVLKGIVTPNMAEVVTILARRPGQFISAREIAGFIHRRDKDGGPIQAENSVSNTITYNRRRLKAMGWNIVSKLGTGGGFALVVDNGDSQ